MRRVVIVVVLIVAAGILGMWRSSGGVKQGLSRVVGAREEQTEAKDEIRKSFTVEPGTRLEIYGINGGVEVQTSDTKTLEVYVLRTAGSQEDLGRRQVNIEQTSTAVTIKTHQSHNVWSHLFGNKAKEQVTIKAPRQITLALKGVNGQVVSQDIDGSVEVKGINGRVELAAASDSAELSGINGNIVVGFRQLSRGARLSGINGNIELRVAGDTNADLNAKGMNGSVRSEIPEIVVDKDDRGSRYSARIGNGGSPITISGINGNVRLARLIAVTAASNDTKDVKELKGGKDQRETKSAK